MDDGPSNYHIYNNLCLNGGIKLREGFQRICENNIMVNNSFHPHVWYKNSQDVFRNNIVFTEYKPIRVPTPWGKQCDLNVWHNPGMKDTSPAVQLQKQSALDAGSIIADAMFINQAGGDYRVKEDSPAIKLGFKNFAMDKFGVQTPKLKSIAKTPVLPAKWTKPQVVMGASAIYWQGASVKELSGEEFSAFGVSKEQGGIHLVTVPAKSFAALAGFQKGDLVQTINEKATKTTTQLLQLTNEAKGQPLEIQYVRGQKSRKMVMTNYVYVESEGTRSEFKRIPLLGSSPKLAIEAITTAPETSNQPVAVLYDGKIDQNYGPVFQNGTKNGTYIIDLGRMKPIKEIRTFSFDMNGSRGSQKFTVFGVTDKNAKPVPIAMVNVNAREGDKYVASKIVTAGRKKLGSYRWLHWVVEPVTRLNENTAFQEFQIR